VVEADLAFQGVDLRDLYRRGSGLTPRRLWLMVRSLPHATMGSPGALLWHVLDAEQEAAEQEPTVVITPEYLRARQAHYAMKGGAGD
jgi:hypothetical protein